MIPPALDALSTLAAKRGEVLRYVPPSEARPFVLVSVPDPRGVK